ncbi:MAG: hypothetical protein P4L50_04655, partial [Anaerolineaceae bacterium]|nr:hypothetical protein [Anaerolineaceae bacterium]
NESYRFKNSSTKTNKEGTRGELSHTEALRGGQISVQNPGQNWAQINSLDRDRLKDFMRGLIEKVELDAAAAAFQLTYYLNAGNKLASPRGLPDYLTRLVINFG